MPSSLFDPVALGPLTLKNRIVMAPMTTLLDAGGGSRYEAFYDARARGGVAMITLNLQAIRPGIVPRGTGADPAAPVLLALNDDVHVRRLAALTARLHSGGSLVCAQLAVGATIALGPGDDHVATLTPSGLDVAGPGVRPDVARLPFFERGRPATPAELAEVVEAVARAATRAAAAGFDAIQVSAAGGSLPAQFLSPRLNIREDDYGGDLAGRARLALEILAAVRAAVPKTLAVLCRINGDDLLPGGMNAGDYAELVPQLEAAGAQAVDILPGGFLSRQPVNQSCVPEAAFAIVARTLRHRARVPVFAGTRISTPERAARIVARGDADIVSLGTALIADPEWPRKAADDRAQDIRPCTSCCRCWNDLAERHIAIGCSVNPDVGDEGRPAPRPAAVARRVTIVGAGIAGLTAAVDAARAGHRVTVIERRAEAGGQVRDLARLPYKDGLAAFLAWLTREVTRSGAELRFGLEASPAAVLATRPDVVVLAAGHVPLDLGRHVDPGRRTRSCADVLHARVFTGARAAVVGAGRDACETAEWLAMAGMTVTLVAPTTPGRDLGTWTRWPLLDRLEALGVTVVAGAGEIEVGADEVRVARIGEPSLTVRASVIVRATGWTPATVSEEQLGTLVRVTIARGDSTAEDGVGEAIRAGLRAVRAI